MLGMAGNATAQFRFVRPALLLQCRRLIFVASCAEAFWHIFFLMQLDILWLVSRVAKQAIILLHRFFVPFMTIETNTGRRMLAMTIGAILSAVAARHVFKVLIDLLMAGNTNRRMWLIFFQIQH